MDKVCIIGLGYVGYPLAELCQKKCNVMMEKGKDKVKEKAKDSAEN